MKKQYLLIFILLFSFEFSFTQESINEIQNFSSGQTFINLNSEPIGDTLTVIQRPILNIPEIVVPGQGFEIMCSAPSTAANWQASLIHGDYSVPLTITESVYSPDLNRWYLTAVAPDPDIFELYDLKVSALGIIEDTTANAVHLIQEEKESYYFIHITDTHLPTHYYLEDPQSAWDTSEMVDFREVINDINLIHPEFVLLTGDLVNEGELEDYENRRYYSKAQRMLKEFDVPVYLVSGNHDIGGWPATPVPLGTGRHNWWRFFGWKWLLNPPNSDPFHTQNYSFDYGNTHYVGMEAYINYDGYMSTIYGNKSFTLPQIAWLENDLLYAPENSTRVLFYHKDFKNQINLSAMEVDMALYGHIHHNSGNIYLYPYNLATDNICDGGRAYRLIRVNDCVLQPLETSYAGDYGEKLEIEYSPANNGLYDSVSAQISNDLGIEFEHAQIKFTMPNGNFIYEVTNGVLDQADKSGYYAVCYVNVIIPVGGIITVSIKAVEISQNIYDNAEIPQCKLYQNYPNPFLNKTSISYYLPHNDFVELNVFDITGRLIRTLVQQKQESGVHITNWNISGEGEQVKNNSVFICQLKTGSGYVKNIRMLCF